MVEKPQVGTGEGGMVRPEDLYDSDGPGSAVLGDGETSMVEQAAALGNGADSEVDGMAGGSEPGRQGLPQDLEERMAGEAATLGSGEEARAAAPAGEGNGEEKDWSEVDRHSERVLGALYSLLGKEREKAQTMLRDMLQRSEVNFGNLLKQLDDGIGAKFRSMQLLVEATMGAAGREHAAAAWRGPAEALRLLGGVLAGLSEKAGQDGIEPEELANMSPVLKTAEDLLLRACQHEEGRLPVIDEALGGTGTHGARTAVVAASAGEAVALVEKMRRGTETPSRKAIAVLVAGGIVQLAGVFGAEGENSEFVRRVERLRQERAGPVEGAESSDVRAFRADFGKEMDRLRSAMRWRERGIWAAGAAVCLLLGWTVGISDADFSFVGRLL